MFNRTMTGLVNKYLFYPEPVVWVEGRDDFSFYAPLITEKKCKIQDAGGKENCLELAKAIVEKDYPFVVIVDGDYNILEQNKNPHRRVLVLKKYSIENYFFEKVIVQAVCSKYLGTQDDIEKIGAAFDELEDDISKAFFELVILDIVNIKKDLGLNAFPEHFSQIIDTKKIRCIPDRIDLVCGEYKKHISEEHITEIKNLVASFLKNGRFSDLIRGHLLFGLIRHFVIDYVKKIKKKKPNIDNDSLLIMLALEMWQNVPSATHKGLKSELSVAIKDMYKMLRIKTA